MKMKVRRRCYFKKYITQATGRKKQAPRTSRHKNRASILDQVTFLTLLFSLGSEWKSSWPHTTIPTITTHQLRCPFSERTILARKKGTLKGYRVTFIIMKVWRTPETQNGSNRFPSGAAPSFIRRTENEQEKWTKRRGKKVRVEEGWGARIKKKRKWPDWIH